MAAAVFLRWAPHHGTFVGLLAGAALCVALTSNVTRKRRFRRAVQGINDESLPASTASVLTLAASVAALALMGIYTLLFFPLA
ncbi:DUF202 domain-containing protein [Paenarthrobacter ureafaciens]|uniref:DUF202 domain-containing protein n=1 Tax=Paenarthrobacter ureafaciens TaxID=37931 RepID=UPI003F5C4408